jgi:hypothetical protein
MFIYYNSFPFLPKIKYQTMMIQVFLSYICPVGGVSVYADSEGASPTSQLPQIFLDVRRLMQAYSCYLVYGDVMAPVALFVDSILACPTSQQPQTFLDLKKLLQDCSCW